MDNASVPLYNDSIMTKTAQQISLKLDQKIIDELSLVARQVGFQSPEELLTVYVREVIIASRIEQATMGLRDTIARGSSDLDELIVARSTAQ